MSRRLKIIQALVEHRNTSLLPELKGPQGGAALKLNQDNFNMSVAPVLTALCPGFLENQFPKVSKILPKRVFKNEPK